MNASDEAVSGSGRRRRQAETVHFRIGGEDFTRAVRDMMLSGKPDSAWRAITTGLLNPEPGVTERLAVALLSGKERLVTDGDGMHNEDDPDSGEYLALLRQIYAGRVRIEGRWYTPYAVVRCVGQEAHDFALRQQGRNEFSAWKCDRAQAQQDSFRFYASDGDRVMSVRGHGVVLFRPSGEQPFWWEPIGPLEASVAEFLDAGHALEVIDARQDPPPRAPRTELVADPVSRIEYDEAALAASLEAQRTDPRRVAAVDAVMTRMRLREQAEADRAREDAAAVSAWRQQILAQAAGDMMEVHDEHGAVVAVVPRVPFLRWRVRRTSLWHLAPAWENVVPEGMKLCGDSRDHSDWYVGAGYDFSTPYYGSPIDKAATWELMLQQRELGRFDCAVLSGGAEVTGRVGLEVVVLPNLSPAHTEAVLGAKAVIAERGGELVHLAIVAREAGIPMVVVPGALSKFPVGTMVSVDTAAGRVRAESEY